MKDEIIEEIRAIRHQISAEFGHDAHKYCEYLMRRQEEMKREGHVYYDFSKPSAAVESAEPESMVLREDTGK